MVNVRCKIMKSTRSTFLLLSKVLLALTIIGLFLPFVGGYEFVFTDMKYGLFNCLLVSAVVSGVSILYTYVNFRRDGKFLNSESIAVDYLFNAIAIYAFAVPSWSFLGGGRDPRIGFIFMLVGLFGSLIFLIAASMQEEMPIEESKQSANERAVFLFAPIVVAFSGIFILQFQIGDEYFPVEIIASILAVGWIYRMQSYYAKKDKFPLKTKYIIILLIVNIIFSMAYFFYRYQQIDLFVVKNLFLFLKLFYCCH